MARIVSLIPSATEIVCALGCEDQLVGRSHECDFPLSVQHLPVCTTPQFNPIGTSREIDHRVKTLLTEAVSLYQVDRNQVKSLRPDLIFTQAQCDVCAVNLKEVEEALCGVLGNSTALVSLAPNHLNDVWQDVQTVADALGMPDRGRDVVRQVHARIKAISDVTGKQTLYPTVGCLEWLDPFMASANWMPELVGLAGGRNLFGSAGEQAPWIDWDMVREHDPDVLLLLPCGFPIERTLQEMALLTGRPGWATLTAVRMNRVFVTDGNQYFNRPGPRLVDSLEILAEILHPSLFLFGHEGIGWVRWGADG